MSRFPESTSCHGNTPRSIEIADETMTYRSVEVDDLTPTGAQLARAAGFKASRAVVVLQVLPDGALETIRPEEVVDLLRQDGRFVVVSSDRVYLLAIDEQRFEWPCRIVSGGVLRKLAQVPEEKGLYLERVHEPDRFIGACDLVDLDEDGVESFVSRKATWKLNVHGVDIQVATPTISVSAAMEQAGFDITKPWHIYFKVSGEPKREVTLKDVLDLKTPGIEKLRLTPRNVDNGEAPRVPRRAFSLLDADVAYLDRLRLTWETIIDGGRRWLLLHQFPLPRGYTITHTSLALEIPPTYPGAAIYGFYAYPPLVLKSGRPIPRTQLRAPLLNREFHGWSRHRGRNNPWNATTDNVVTHMGLVDAALAKEVDQ